MTTRTAVSDDQSSRKKGYLYALAASFFLSTTALFIRHLSVTYQVPAIVMSFWRDLFAALVLMVILLVIKPSLLKFPKEHAGFLALYGALLAGFNIYWALSVVQNGAAVATVLVYSSAPFIAILGWWFLHEKLNLPKVIAMAFAIAGCIVVSIAGATLKINGQGLLTGLLAGLFYAIYTLMGRGAHKRKVNTWTSVFYTFLVAAILLLVINLLPLNLPGKAQAFSDIFWLGTDWGGWLWMFLLAAIPTLLGFGTYNLALTLLDAITTNLFLTLEPIFTAVMAYLLFGERLTWIQALGGMLVVGGVVLLRLVEKKQLKT